MSRPTDWSPVGLTADPTPGDPAVVRRGGQSYTDVASRIRRAANTMRALEAGIDQSQSVKELLASRDTIVTGIDKAAGRYEAAGAALTDYSTVLNQVQLDTSNALATARTAQADKAHATRMQDHYRRLREDAPESTDSETIKEYQKKEGIYATDVQDAESTISQQQQLIRNAVETRDQAAVNAINKINAATEADQLNDGWWENWGSKLTRLITAIAEIVSAFTGILALLVCWIPVFGQALAGVLLLISAVTGIIAALGNIVLASTGEKSWSEAILSIAFAALGCVGLGWFRGIAGALKLGTGLSRAAAGLSRVTSALPAALRVGAQAVGTVLRYGGLAVSKIFQAAGMAVAGTGFLIYKGLALTFRGITRVVARLRGAPQAARAGGNAVAESTAAYQRATQAYQQLPKNARFANKTTASDGQLTLSGWGANRPEGFAEPNIDDVLALSDEIGHARKGAGAYDQGKPGQYFASHAERQEALIASDPNIGVSRPICPDCQGFFSKLASHQSQTWTITDPDGTWQFLADGSVIRPDGTIYIP